MGLKARLFVSILSLILFIVVLNLIRKKRIRIEYSLLWLNVSLIIVLVSVWSDLADQVAYLIGIDYPPALFFLIAIIFFILILLHFSIELTRLKDNIKILVQELSLLKERVARKEDRAGQNQSGIDQKENRNRS